MKAFLAVRAVDSRSVAAGENQHALFDGGGDVLESRTNAVCLEDLSEVSFVAVGDPY